MAASFKTGICLGLILFGLIFLFYYPGFWPGFAIIDGTVASNYPPWKDQNADQKEVNRTHIPISDPVTQFYPWNKYFEQSLFRGIIPLWNPYAYSGSPLLANYQTGFFCPYYIFYWFLPGSYSLQLKLLLQLMVAGIGMYLLSRQFKIRPMAALLGAILFM